MPRYLTLAEFWLLAELVTDVPTRTPIPASRVDLANSAVHAPLTFPPDVD